MTSSSPILLIDANAPWVRSLAAALPGVRDGTQRLHAWHVFSLPYWLQHCRSRREEAGTLSPLAPHPAPPIIDTLSLVPGWTRFHRLSTALLAQRIRRFLRRFGPPAAIIYTLPHYADVARQFSAACRQVYYAADAFRFYAGWPAAQIDALEHRLLHACHLTFAVSRPLVADLQRHSPRPVLYSPNAVAQSFVDQLSRPAPPMPGALKPLPGKIIGCIGELSERACDWPLIAGLAHALPGFTFVFIGPLADDPPGSRARVRRILDLPNVRWLGPVPHAALAPYLAHFGLCFAPYADNPLNHRRSPLRLYDYLATTKPILSTPIAEASALGDLVEIGASVGECVRHILKLTAPGSRLDLPQRRRFLRDNTWEARAAEFWRHLTSNLGLGTLNLEPTRKSSMLINS